MEKTWRIYDHLLTKNLIEQAAAWPESRAETSPLDLTTAHGRLARHVAREVERALRSVSGEKEERLEKQASIVNDLLSRLRELSPPGPPDGEDVVPPPRLLLSLHEGDTPLRTELPFAVSTVLTRARGEPALGHELSREIASSDSIDALLSFVTMSGVRALVDVLRRHASAGRELRLLTTTYIGATEADAVNTIARLPNTRVRISYDVRRTRLHAKAWLFSRTNGLDTAYVGSANLSSSALFHGNEWMVKVSASDLPLVIEKIRGTFETLWNDVEFEAYDPKCEEHRQRLRRGLKSERGGQMGVGSTFFTLAPFPFQTEILERLDAERRLHGRTRNLVVAATGTGKTVVAAFDYRRRVGADGVHPRLLYLAHRAEILRQALATFRNVLRDGAFGDILAEGNEPSTSEHLFATIASFNSRELLTRHGPDYWDHVVIDECHHVPAPSYLSIARGIRPRVLVGLTATPERTDGQSLLPDFDGRIAAELRLWHALERQLLVPFEYYGISDNTDLRDVRWTRGAYQLDHLDKVYSGNDRRADLVIEQVLRRVGDGRRMCALGFCVSVRHAEFMARKFSEAGIPAIAVHGSSEMRAEAPGRLARRDVNVVFTCDLYNEGVDLPFLDTLLLLRPTSSATLFLQQLGRGLRLHERKDSCLVLDFIGQHREEFRFDLTLSALTGIPRGGLREAVERGFPRLAAGCHLELDRVARSQILASLRRSLRANRARLMEDLKAVLADSGPGITLRTFLERSGRSLEEVFTKRSSWAQLRREVGIATPAAGPREEDLAPCIHRLLHIDEPARLALYRALLADPEARAPADPLARRRLLMLVYQLLHSRGDLHSPESFLGLLRSHPAVAEDIAGLCDVLDDRVSLTTEGVPPPDPAWPLAVHRRYERREVLTAVGRWTESGKPDSREGVVRLDEARTEILFVTLDKTEKRFTPTTSYEDYAIGAELFHWQTQSTVSPESPTGRRYIDQTANGWRFLLFVRPTTDDAFTYLGPAHHVKHAGSRPMSITWRLEVPIPGHWLVEYTRLAG